MSACAGTPVSWLRLERFHAGELDAPEREAIASHVASCDACASCLRRIDEDTRELAPLPAVAAKAVKVERRGVVVALRRAAPWIGALAVAAAVVLVVGRTPKVDPRTDETRIKGTDVTFSLVRDDESVVAEGGALYRDGDRFKAQLSCPPGMRGGFDVAVYERGEASFPLDAQTDLACGNDVALPGAFRVTGSERMTVCLVWSDAGAVDRDAVRRSSPEALPHALCKVLTPVPSQSP